MQKNYQEYYLKNRVRLCEKQVDVYMPNSIRKIGKMIPEKILELYNLHPFEKYDSYLLAKLKTSGIKSSDIAFDECYEAAMIGYMYSIHRCAYMNYEHIENYIKFMIRCCIKFGVVLANKERYNIKDQDMKIVYLDSENNLKKY